MNNKEHKIPAVAFLDFPDLIDVTHSSLNGNLSQQQASDAFRGTCNLTDLLVNQFYLFSSEWTAFETDTKA